VSATAATGQVDELERYRRAVEDTMQQLDWCVGYLYGLGKRSESHQLAQNCRTIRANLLSREPQPVPAGDSSSR
jgi:hypothetical protein